MSLRGHVKAAGLAHELGVTESTISRWKNGQPITVQNAIALSQALSVTLDWLLQGKGTPDGYAIQPSMPPEPKLSKEVAQEVIEFMKQFTR